MKSLSATKQENIGHFRSQLAKERFEQAYREAMEELPIPTDTYDVPTRFGTARIYKFGDNPSTPILLLPGRAASTPMWQPNLATLAEQKTVFTVDLIGEPGMSIQSRAFNKAADQALWLHEVLSKLKIEKTHIVGVSIGGWSAVNLAMYDQAPIASLTLLDPASVFGHFTWKVIVISLGSVLPFMPQTIRMKLLSWISGGVEANDDEPTAKLIASGMRDYKLNIPAPTYPSDADLQSITIPVLAIIAGRSIIHNPQKAVERAQQLLPNPQVELWAEASHALNGEYPERVCETILNFIDNQI